jgi:hypothetical protein
MRILALITEPEELRKILRHLVKIGRSPPGFDPALLNLQSCKIRGREKEIAVAMRKRGSGGRGRLITCGYVDRQVLTSVFGRSARSLVDVVAY